MSINPIELWAWRNCKEAVKTLPGRLGFPKGDRLEVLGFEINTINGSIKDTLTGEPVDALQRTGRRAISALFYVLSAYSESQEKKPTGRLVSSKQIRGTRFTGRDTFGERDRITKSFKEPAKLEAAAKALGGSKVEFPYGDTAVSLNLLPFIPVTIVLSVDDGEFPADARIFYDETVENYLDAEQAYFLTSLTVSRLIQSGKS